MTSATIKESTIRPGLPVGPAPVEDPDSKPFWDACRNGELRMQQCSECGTVRFPPSPVCHSCRSWTFTWESVPPVGKVHSWVTVGHALFPYQESEIPYVVALVEVLPGVRIPARLADCEPEDVVAGMEVELAFRDVGGDVVLPEFRAMVKDI